MSEQNLTTRFQNLRGETVTASALSFRSASDHTSHMKEVCAELPDRYTDEERRFMAEGGEATYIKTGDESYEVVRGNVEAVDEQMQPALREVAALRAG